MKKKQIVLYFHRVLTSSDTVQVEVTLTIYPRKT